MHHKLKEEKFDMSIFKYSDKEKELNKVLKMNQDISKNMLDDKEMKNLRNSADDNIESSITLLRSLGKGKQVDRVVTDVKSNNTGRKLENRPVLEDWNSIVRQADEYCPNPVVLEDILSPEEINYSFAELDEINRKFSQKTSIVNKVDLTFLAVATAVQVAKSLIFPLIASKFGYGDTFDKSERMDHNDRRIQQKERSAKDSYRDKKLQNRQTGDWINMLYQTPPYDITRGSSALGINMEGAYHRMHTLGHDPILGWVFGTMNILTDVITLNDFRSFRVKRNPMVITPEAVPMWKMFYESYELVKSDFIYLPTAVFAQAQHLESDKYTKIGLPVPILSSINENLASKLYKSNYDALCFARDIKIVGASFVLSKIFDMIIGLVHGLFRKSDESQELYEVRTRKILLISNSIATTSSIIASTITSNPKSLDIGSLINTLIHLFSDVRYFAKIKKQFIEQEISGKLQAEIYEIDKLFEEI